MTKVFIMGEFDSAGDQTGTEHIPPPASSIDWHAEYEAMIFARMFNPDNATTAARVKAMGRCLVNPLFNKTHYSVMFEDAQHTYNINMHTGSAFTTCPVDALEMIYRRRPELEHRPITTITRTPFLDFIN